MKVFALSRLNLVDRGIPVPHDSVDSILIQLGTGGDEIFGKSRSFVSHDLRIRQPFELLVAFSFAEDLVEFKVRDKAPDECPNHS